MICSELRFDVNRAKEEDVLAHFERCDALFTPPLSARVCLPAYAKKIRTYGVTFEAWADKDLVGLVVGYFNDCAKGEGFVSNVSVEKVWQSRQVATGLICKALEWGRQEGFRGVRLEVQRDNLAAIRLYERLGFLTIGHRDDSLVMVCADLRTRVSPSVVGN